MGSNLHLESFLEFLSVERGAASNTLAAYRRDVLDFFKNLPGDASKCSRDDIIKYMQSLGARGYSGRTRARRLSSLNQFFMYLYTEKIRADNPATNIDAPKLEKSLPKFLSEKEIGKLMTAVESDPRLKAMLELLYAGGFRVSELISLKKTSLRKDGADYFVIVKGKGNKERMVPVGKPAIKAIEAYQKSVGGNSAWLFPSGKSHITRQRFGQLLKSLAVKAGVDPKKLSPHVLRHSFASHMLSHGADLRLVQELLGHEQIATTQIYTHIQSTKLHALVKKHHPLAK